VEYGRFHRARPAARVRVLAPGCCLASEKRFQVLETWKVGAARLSRQPAGFSRTRQRLPEPPPTCLPCIGKTLPGFENLEGWGGTPEPPTCRVFENPAVFA